MLFKVHSDIAKDLKDFFELNEGAKVVPEFNSLTSRQMFTVSLIADKDFDSPLRNLSDKLRREKAVILAGYGMEGNRPDKNARNVISGKVEAIERAIIKYNELQPDLDKVMIQSVQQQIYEAIQNKQGTKLPKLREAMVKLLKDSHSSVPPSAIPSESLITYSADDLIDADDLDEDEEKLSTLDKIMAKRRKIKDNDEGN